MNNLTVSLLVVIAALGGFYGGAKVEQGKIPASNVAVNSPLGTTGKTPGATGAGDTGTRGATGATGATGPGGGTIGSFGRGTSGQVSALNGNTLILTDAQGQQVKVQLSDTTPITKTVQGSRSDLQQGVTIAVQGQRESDGTVTASAITILPAGTRVGGGGGGGGGGGAPPGTPGG
ncbi:MAG TPA: DUF5666 domain-containing protein [Candidatus Dormibacteraeota bacterium]